MDVARVETELREQQLMAEVSAAVEEALSSARASDELKQSGLGASSLRISPTANMGGVGEAFVIAVAGAVAKKLVDELWKLVSEKLQERHPAQIYKIEPFLKD